jgi:uncharacterized protein (TIGR02996 family)
MMSNPGQIDANGSLSAMSRQQAEAGVLTQTNSYQVDEKGQAVSVAFSIDGKSVAIAYHAESSSSRITNKVLVWDLLKWKQRKQILGCTESVSDIAFSPDGQSLICVGGTKARFMGGEICIWNTRSWKKTHTIEGDGIWSLRSVASSPDGTLIATGSALSGEGDDKLSLWDSRSAKWIRTFGLLNNDVKGLAFSPDGKSLAVGVSGDRTVSMWNVAKGRQLWITRAHAEANDLPVVFAPDGKRVASCGDKNVGIWNPKTGASLAVLKGHNGDVSAIAFSQDGSLLFSCGWQEILVWDMNKLKLVHSEAVPRLHAKGLRVSDDNTTLTLVHTINNEIIIRQYRLSIPERIEVPQVLPTVRVDRSTSETKTLLAILKDPENDGLRLAYADDLEQKGDPRGEFIRIQCRLHEYESVLKLNAKQKSEKSRLVKQQQTLLKKHFQQWTAALAPLQVRPEQVQFSRGLISSLELRDVDVTDDSLKVLREVPELEKLDIDGTAVTNDGLSNIAAIANLRELQVSETKVTTDRLEELGSLKRLIRVYNSQWGNQKIPEVESLKLKRNRRFLKLPKEKQRQSAIEALNVIVGWLPTDDQGEYKVIRYSQSWASDADLVYLQAIPEVAELDFFECRAVTSEGMKHLRPLQNLRTLRLTESGVTDLESIRRLKHLEDLELDSLEELDPASFRYLPELKNLKRLSIRFCGLGDAVLPYIARCTELRELTMIYSNCSNDGLKELLKLKKLEKLEIDYEDENRELINTLLGKNSRKRKSRGG